MFNQSQQKLPGSPSPFVQGPRDWKKIVEGSKDLKFAPEKFISSIKSWNENREKLRKSINEISEQEVKLKVELENLILSIREYYAEKGDKSIWSADVGVESGALKDGQYIIRIQNDESLTS